MGAVRKPVPGLNPSNPGGKLSPEDKVVSMLSKINCDLVTVQTAIWLGKRMTLCAKTGETEGLCQKNKRERFSGWQENLCNSYLTWQKGWDCMCKDRWNWMSTSEEQKEKVLRLARKLMRQEGIRTGQSLWASRYDTKTKTAKNGISIPDERAAGNGRAELKSLLKGR